MALTLQKVQSDLILGNRRSTIYNITGDANYVTGGYAVTGPNFGLRNIEGVDQIAGNTTGSTVAYNTATGKIQFYTNGAEVGNGTNISAVTAKVLVLSTDD